MAMPVSAPTVVPERSAIPASLLNVCFALFVINAAFFPSAFSALGWIFDDKGLGIPTDFVNVWSAGLITPYLFLYDLMVLAIAVALLVRVGLRQGFARYELSAMGLVVALLMFFPLVGAPTGFVATLIVSGLIAGHCGLARSRASSSPKAKPGLGFVALGEFK